MKRKWKAKKMHVGSLRRPSPATDAPVALQGACVKRAVLTVIVAVLVKEVVVREVIVTVFVVKVVEREMVLMVHVVHLAAAGF